MPEPPGAEQLLDRLSAVADGAMRASGVPGVALGVAAAGRTAATGLGVTSVAAPRPVTPDTVFRYCSVTKPFTATLAYALAEAGRLDLDAPISAYLPALRLAVEGSTDRITPRQLLLHLSGLECELDRDLFGYGRDDGATGRMLADYATLRQFAAPGELWGYGNAGYWLLGAILAAVAETSYEDAIRQRVLTPLEMTSTGFLAEEAILHPVALPHRPTVDGAAHQEPIESFAFPRVRTASGGLIGSVRDLLRFALLHLGATEPIIADSSRRELRRPVVPSYDRWTQQATGWAVQAGGLSSLVWHGGSYRGYKSTLILIPELGLATAVLTNSVSGSAVINAVTELIRHDVLGQPPRTLRFVDLPTGELARLAGAYAYPGARVDIRPGRGGLLVAVTPTDAAQERQELLLRPISRHEFAQPGQDRPDLAFLPTGGGPMRIRLGLRLGRRLDRHESGR